MGASIKICYVMLCYVMLCYVMLCYVMLCYVMLCYVMLCYVMLCYVMLCYVMLCYVMLCYVMLCYVMLCSSFLIFGIFSKSCGLRPRSQSFSGKFLRPQGLEVVWRFGRLEGLKFAKLRQFSQIIPTSEIMLTKRRRFCKYRRAITTPNYVFLKKIYNCCCKFV